jgi:cytochrome c biogenesis protein CcdA
MPEWIQQIMSSSTPSLAVLPAALLLGVLGAVTSCGCNLAVVGAVAGFSGSLSEGQKRKHILFGGLFFMLGTVIALGILGAVTGFVGKMAGASLGKYWKLVAGLIMVFFGLASLDFLPFKLPSLQFGAGKVNRGLAGSAVYGLAVGGGTTACSVFCNPILPVALGYTTLQGGVAWGAAVLGMFALGYSLPLAAGLVGLGLGLSKLRGAAEKAAPVVRIVAGVLLIGVGFYLLATIA